ncbi:MAG: hypothetical protein ACRDLB_07830 [Actinomycetota bacterium]
MDGQATSARPGCLIATVDKSRITAFNSREFLFVCAIGIVLSVVTTWPLAVNLSTHFPQIGYGDPYITSWWLAWDGYALIHQPLQLFDANVFWPLQDSLAMSEATLGYAPVASIGSGAVAAVVRYNLLFMFTYALAFVGTYLFARELTVSPVAAAVGGAIFAYAPFRMDQATHLQIISSGAIPLALFLLLRGYKSGSAATALTGWLVATWQLSLGFSLGLPLAYLFAALGTVAFFVWLSRGRPHLPSSLIKATIVGIVIFAVWGVIQARPYFRLTDEFPQGRRTEADIQFYSPPPRGLLSAPAANLIWGTATEPIRETLERPEEKSLFPGAIPVVLGLSGVVAGGWSRGLRFGLSAGIVGCTLLSLGYAVPGGRWMFGILFRYLPGWDAIRTPGRLITFTTLGLALLASIGAERVRRSLFDRLSPERAVRIGPAVVAVLAVLVVLEGSGSLNQSPVRRVPAGQIGVPAPQFHIPSNEFHDRFYMLWSTEGFPAIANGEGAFAPPFREELRAATVNFPDQASVDYLRTHGIASVIFHPDLAPETLWEQVPTRSVEGLAVTRSDEEGVIVYRIAP